ncbi:MAG: hypothetical protein PVSMB4_17590 [Ktedonobacterales bacterium]
MAPSASQTAVRIGPAPAGTSHLTPLAAPDSGVLPAPRRTTPNASPKVVLTARSWLVARPDASQALRAGRYRVRTAPAWDQLLDSLDECAADIVIVDLDDANRGHGGHLFAMSGYRLVALLGRLATVRHFALIVQTALDYAEIEDLARHGTHALVSPETSGDNLLSAIQAATKRITTGRWQAQAPSEYAPLARGSTGTHWLPDMPGRQVPPNPDTIWAN